MKTSKIKICTKITMVCALFLSVPSFGRAPDDSELRAAPTLANSIARWVTGLKETPRSIGIFNIFSNTPLDQDFSTVMEAEMVAALKREGVLDVSSCTECRAPSVVLQGEKLIIRKGTPDAETLEKLSERHPVDAFLVVDINRTQFYLIGQATLYHNPSGSVIGSERFEIPALKFNETSVQVLITGGLGNAMGPGASGLPLSTALGLGIYEELGFGKGGLTLGTVMGGSLGTLIYANPSLSFRGRFGASAMTWTLNLGAGLGLLGSARGVALRGAYDVYLGSWTVVGLEGVYFLPGSGSTATMSGFAGLHLGISIGR